ncbi:related to golgi-specific brefeldin a-resistance guanine nucleotide exchange factor 1 [Melanopsichium pennsylvanicum]|uniref:Related to golgi-specific brefeldin a-resistance guanine nucleotide exchange factor 1 n=2 Tax=Melanopsichium pennsylvanicum TaxID=63383 RepID=A0AAJ5C3K9_9BASI|nr:related to golgi-specific brefeldin a-resistance guanine nucleotide exchange factor 1 [Melanopsichium pennsylvanicum 4]SNX82559.1 related to golgi-specific brefeldin a-resistance guanine nucleotide exchange factor 1 [Melanopsichium pennsylvanicum]
MASPKQGSLAGTTASSQSHTPAGYHRSAHAASDLAPQGIRYDSVQASQPMQSAAVATLQSHKLHLVLSEITSVASTMRKATRWNATTSAALARMTSYSYSSAQAQELSMQQQAHPNAQGAVPPKQSQASTDTPVAATSSSAHIALRAMQRGSNTDTASTSTAAATKLGISLGIDGKSDDPVSLLTGFATLKAQIRTCPNFSNFPLPTLLAPFLRVILSPRTSAPVTSAALQAVHKFLVYKVVCHQAPGAQIAAAEIAHATSHCRFEASEATTDELVLVRILSVMRELICEPTESNSTPPGPVVHDQNAHIRRPDTLADCLGDDSICEMMETGLSMCCQTRLSEVLRRTAELSMTAMVRTIFSRLPLLPPSADEFFVDRPDGTEPEPEHATLAAEPVGEDAEVDERRRRRMTMPDPTSSVFPAAAAQVLDQLKDLGEEEEAQEAAASSQHAADATQHGDPNQHPTKEFAVPSDDTHDTADASTDQIETAIPEVAPAQVALATAAIEIEPFGLPAILEVCRVIVSLLDPNNLQHTNTMRRLGMSMLISVLETSGRSIGDFPSLRALMQDTACKHLFTLARSDDTIPLSLSLRALSTMFETMREHLKLQHELFLHYLMDRLAPTFPLALEPWNERTFDSVAKRALGAEATTRLGTPDSSASIVQLQPPPPPAPPAPPLPKTSDRAPATGEARELYLETFALLFRNFDAERSAEYLIDLYLNYDCYTDNDNMYERVLHFLCRSIHAANPHSPTQQDPVQLFALDALLSFIAAVAERHEAEQVGEFEHVQILPGELTFEALALQKAKKATILDGASRFNAKPKDGLAFLEKEGLLDYGDASMPREDRIARFLKECPRLDKKLVGDYIGRPDNVKVLEAFVRLFDFKDKPIAEALREMLESFRLPGESQQIERITQTFASTYFAAKPEGIITEDAVFILSYSVIMLNTDQHNPQNKRRMTVDDYRKNLRGVNGGEDFSPELTGAIYESIRKREIVMPEEHAGQLGFEYAWKELLRRSRTAGTLVACNTTAFDRDMFETSWKPILSSIAFAFSTYADEYMVERAISGIRQCGILASEFDLIEVFDFMVHTLASATGLLDGSVPQTLTSNATVEVEDQQITVSPLSTRFGVNFKGQLAAVVLFTIANGNVDAIRTGWSDLFEIFKNLFAHGMLPASMVQMEDLSDGPVPIPLKPKKLPGPSPQDARAQGGGLFSTLSSYLLSPYSNVTDPAPYEATPEDVEATLSSVDCIASCRLEELWHQVLNLDTASHLCAVHYLRFQIEALTVEKVLFQEPGNWNADVTSATNKGSESNSKLSKDAGHLPGATTTFSRQPNSGEGTDAYRSSAGLPLGYDPRVTFLLELLTQIVTSSPSQLLAETWTWVSEHITTVLRNAKAYHPMIVEREVGTLLRIISVAAAEESLRDQIFLALDLLRELPVEIRISDSKQLLAGLTRILASHPAFVRSHTEWSLIFALIADKCNTRNPDSSRLAFHATKVIVGHLSVQMDEQHSRVESSKVSSQLSPDNFLPAVAQLVDFVTYADTSAWRNSILRESPHRRLTLTEQKEMTETEKVHEERGIQALGLLESITAELPRLVSVEFDDDGAKLDQVWSKYWLALLTGIAKQWINAYAPVRSAAVSLLQRALFSPLLVADVHPPPSRTALIRTIFSATLFPLIEDLLKPQVYQIDPPSAANRNGGMLEVRIRASALVCKTFLHLMPQLAPIPSDLASIETEVLLGEQADVAEFQKLWLDVLDLMDRMINSTGGNAGRRNPLTEAIPENLKNVLLVMSNSQLLAPPTQDERTLLQKHLFDLTHDRVQRFLPGLVEEALL